MSIVLFEEKSGNLDDQEYSNFVHSMSKRFAGAYGDGKTPLFKTAENENLFDVFLDSIPQEDRQYHNCSCCRHFVNRYGSIVSVNDDGSTKSAVWSVQNAPDYYKPAMEAMIAKIKKSKISGVFLTSESELGNFTTGVWHHFSLNIPKDVRYRRGRLTAGQAMAEKREDLKNVMRAVSEFKHETVKQAVAILKTDALYRSEKLLGAAEWLESLYSIKNRNLIWRHIASAPAGFCHPRSSMIGTLLEDLEQGMSFDLVSRRFADKMHPLRYQRPQAAPTAGAIQQAEKLFAELGLGPSLRRRYARFEEVETFWTPKQKKEEKSESLFGHLTPKGEQPRNISQMPEVTMTWVKFRDTVLPDAEEIELLTPAYGSRLPIATILTSADMDAPPILQWDTQEKRNPFSSYVWHGGSDMAQFGLANNSFVKVKGI